MRRFFIAMRTKWFGLFLVVFLLIIGSDFLPAWLVRIPSGLFIPIADWINQSLGFLQDEFWIITTKDSEGFEEENAIVMVLTRSISDAVQMSIDIMRNLLLGGHKGFGLPALPWSAVAGLAFIIGYALNGWRLSMLAGLSMVYIALFGQWQESMQTLSLVFVAVPISIFFGLLFGILSYKIKYLELMIAPFLNIAQSLPHFSYLIPVVVFYGIGDHAGAIATVIFATPPMIRLTLLGLKKIPTEIIESGRMSGCNNRQLLTKVLVPSARHDIMIGVNQVIMQCLAMVVIASFIGASGLGYNLLVMLNGLKIGNALELGVSIVLIAIVLDRLSLAWSKKLPDYRANLPFYQRYKYPLMILIVVLMAVFLSQFFPKMYQINKEEAITTAPFWDAIVDWIVVNWFAALQIFRDVILIQILIPFRDMYLGLPLIAVFVLACGSGYFLGGIRSAFMVFLFISFIALTGWWEKSLFTAYMVTISVLVSVVVGFLVGILSARREFTAKMMLFLCDTFQTFPSFVYLIPVIMLFQVNDVSVVTAVVIYATIPAVRYTIEGLRNVPQDLQDAAAMSGVNKWQRLIKVDLPLAMPHIMLGINQTVLFSLFMVIIGAFIGTQGLGQEIMQALSESNMGKGLVLGLCVAFMGLMVDHLIVQWSNKKKKQLGFETA